MFSHHPPSQYDRTFHLGSIRLCVRCSAVVLGAVLLLGAQLIAPHWVNIAQWVLLVISFATILLGVLAFVLNESGARPSRNSERVIFGLVMGAVICLCWQRSLGSFVALLMFLVLGQFASAWGLKRAGVLDRFFSEYMDGAVVNLDELSPAACHRLFCSCSPGVRLPR